MLGRLPLAPQFLVHAFEKMSMLHMCVCVCVCVSRFALVRCQPLLEHRSWPRLRTVQFRMSRRAFNLCPRAEETIDTFMKRTARWCGTLHKRAQIPRWGGAFLSSW